MQISVRLVFALAVATSLISGLVGGLIVAVLDDDGGVGPALVASVGGDEAAPDEGDSAGTVSTRDDGPNPAPAAGLAAFEAVERVLPGVVILDVELAPMEGEDGAVVTPRALGTGLVLRADGYILTNEHVVRDAVGITVFLADGRQLSAVVIGTDAPFTDVAVVRVEATDLTPVPIGSSQTLRLGETVMAVGNALSSREPSVTVGVVSNRDTAIFRENSLQEFLIQTDAALNHGNSGGALINLQGEVVGLTTTVVRQTDAGQFVDGIGLALQIDAILPIADVIVATGGFPRSSFGVIAEQTVTSRVAQQLGLASDQGSFLVEITQSGPLAEAGLRPGDIVLSIGGIAITEALPYLNVVSRVPPTVPVEVVYRSGNGEDRTVRVTPLIRNR
jgi:2-alkenal reductase